MPPNHSGDEFQRIKYSGTFPHLHGPSVGLNFAVIINILMLVGGEDYKVAGSEGEGEGGGDEEVRVKGRVTRRVKGRGAGDGEREDLAGDLRISRGEWR